MSTSKEHGSVQGFESSNDVLDKAKYDFKRHCEDNEIYSFMDCLLSLNALPDWIAKDASISTESKAENKKIKEYIENDNTIGTISSIEEKMRLVRLICNHSKHGAKKCFPKVKCINGSSFPMNFPIIFGTFVALGDDEKDMRPIVSDIIDFFESLFCN
ncbi:hypothetical protein [Methanolobus vulcani]|uniref:Uncharacterized protein n=1 Tax=Methanolobus vulcani TaxID=38026 RepID=A0A7Z8KSM6_9EURY|nr:hypothetical protein [Methanolobus vulcani]TQD28255.1 hypothetical protein FKV42_00870 [Methanolobus vulcani]